VQLLIATRNPHKLGEIRAILAVRGLSLLGLDALSGLPQVVEDGATFAANAVKKACALALAAGRWTLADDSGLEVDALGGEPGVCSARYAGEPSDDEANNRKLLRKLEGVSNRAARFRCVIALASPAGEAQTVDGVCEGRIIAQPCGRGGFGYDPLFVPDGYELTFAEIDPEAKNGISHRALALGRAVKQWRGIFESERTDW
jgi:XTP/dITP diphosphohydrolase